MFKRLNDTLSAIPALQGRIRKAFFPESSIRAVGKSPSLRGGFFKCIFLLYLTSLATLCADAGSPEKPKKHTLSICAIFRNEARFLKEWIEYHRLVGIDHFYLYNNKSMDFYRKVLDPYIKTGVVSLITWPDCLSEWEEVQTYRWALSTQIPAYEHAIKIKAAPETKWLVFVEVDEFLVPFEKSTLTEELQPYDDYAAITLSRLYYDASKVDTIPRKRLVIESTELTHAEENIQKSVSKTIFKPDRAVGFSWPPYRPCFGCECDKEIELKYQDIRINRYTNRIQKGLLYLGKAKDTLHIDNRTVPMPQMAALLEDGYEIEDQERLIYRFVPEVLKRMGLK